MVASHQGRKHQGRMKPSLMGLIPLGLRAAVEQPLDPFKHENMTMRIHNLYADENGETHFRDIEIEFTETGPDGTTSKVFPATGIIFRTTPRDWFFDCHRTTRRQYVVNLDAWRPRASCGRISARSPRCS